MKIDDGLLTQAFMNSNNRFMDELPEQVELHNFSKGFEKKMHRLILADSKYGGHIWVERVTRYVTKIAVIAICFVIINIASVKAFDFNIWQMIVTKTEKFINVNFQKQNNTESLEDSTNLKDMSMRMKISNIPDNYTQQEFYQDDDMTVQHLTSDKGTITYTESLITDTADINIAAGIQETGTVGNWWVTYVRKEDSITAFFQDEKFYHIIQIQGRDANKEFANKIIEKLEEQ